MTKENISTAIMDSFKSPKSKPNHLLNFRWLNQTFMKTLNPKEVALVDPAIDDLVNNGLLAANGVGGNTTLALTQKGYELIYPVTEKGAIQKIEGIILNRFRSDRSKVGHIIDRKWISFNLFPQLNPREEEYYEAAVQSLIDKGYITISNALGGSLALSQAGFDYIY